MNSGSEIGERIKAMREARGWSQTEAAERVGISREMWGKYERGIAQPGRKVLEDMAAAGLDTGYIITGFESRNARHEQDYIQRRRDAEPLAKKLIEQRGLSDIEEVSGALVMLASNEGVTYNEVVYVADAFEAAAGSIAPDERTLVGDYRRADKHGKAAILTTATALSSGRQPAPGRMTHVIADRGSIAAGRDVKHAAVHEPKPPRYRRK